MSNSVSVVVPCLTEHQWQAELTAAIIRIARCTTKIPFELVIAEAVGRYFTWEGAKHEYPMLIPDKHFHNPSKGSANGDTNGGLALCSGDIVVVLTNDVFVKPGWLGALLECFEHFPDCGMASLATSDHKETAAPIIIESVWCPIFAMRNRPDWRFDAMTFPSEWGDYDLLMRIYASGFKSYRNMAVVCDHLGRATNGSASTPDKAQRIEDYKNKFVARWGAHPVSSSLVFRALLSGWIF